MMSNQVLSMLHDVEKHNSEQYLNHTLLLKAKQLINTMLDGDLLQHMETINLNSLSSSDNLFMYDYGKSALRELQEVAQDGEFKKYFETLKNYINEVEGNNFEHLINIKKFFKVISNQLNNDLENNRYSHISKRSNELFVLDEITF